MLNYLYFKKFTLIWYRVDFNYKLVSMGYDRMKHPKQLNQGKPLPHYRKKKDMHGDIAA